MTKGPHTVLFKICFCHFPFFGPLYLPGPLGAAVWHGKDGRVGGGLEWSR